MMESASPRDHHDRHRKISVASPVRGKDTENGKVIGEAKLQFLKLRSKRNGKCAKRILPLTIVLGIVFTLCTSFVLVYLHGKRVEPSDFITKFTLSERKEQVKDSNDPFEMLKATGKLSSCALDEGDACFNESSRDDAGQITATGRRKVLLRNLLPEDRFWCGKRISGNGGTLELSELPEGCKDEDQWGSLPYVYSQKPPKIPNDNATSDDLADIQAVEVLWNGDVQPTESLNSFPCFIPCKTSHLNVGILNEINIRNTNWKILHTMESPKYYPRFGIRSDAYRENIFYATTSYRSEIPLPYFSWAEWKIQNPLVDFEKAIKGATFLAGNCNSLNDREGLVQDLMTRMRVDSFRCLNNVAEPVNLSNKTALLEKYLFYFAFENSNEDDYITEKVFDGLRAGTLPVYYGALNIHEFVPQNSIIHVADFETRKDLADYLIRLSEDKELYESYHKWRHKPFDDAFRRKYEITNTHSVCRMCEWAFAKRHGLGWNHEKQRIMTPYIDHKTCRDETGLISHPFQEQWLSSSRDGSSGKKTLSFVASTVATTKGCKWDRENRIIDIDRGTIRRKVFDGDGVTDLIIDSLGRETQYDGSDNLSDLYILQLRMPINADGSKQPKWVNDSVLWLQDNRSRIIVMINSGDSDASLSVDQTGTVQIKIHNLSRSAINGKHATKKSTTTRIRVVTENIDHFHEDAKEIPSYFGDLMTRDFFQPIEAYRTTIEMSQVSNKN